jgi:hypothetical protein
VSDVVEKCCECICGSAGVAGSKWGNFSLRWVDIWKRGERSEIFGFDEISTVPDRGNDTGVGDWGVGDGVLVKFAVFAVAVMPRWISARMSRFCVKTFDRSARVMPVLREVMTSGVMQMRER